MSNRLVVVLSVDGVSNSQRSLRHSVTANLQVPRVQGSKGMPDEGPSGVPFRPRPKCIRVICIQIEDYTESVHFFPSFRITFGFCPMYTCRIVVFSIHGNYLLIRRKAWN